MSTPLRLFYDKEAPFGFENTDRVPNTAYEQIFNNVDDGWERWSLPLGNGYVGINVFGRTKTERIQISEKTMHFPHTSWHNTKGGLNNFSETYIDLGHPFDKVQNYQRWLDLETAVSGVRYDYEGVTYERSYFVSYPDKCIVIKLSASKNGKLSFVLRPTVPYKQDFAKEQSDGAKKTGEVASFVKDGIGTAKLSGNMACYDIDFLGIYKVFTDGDASADTVEHTYTDTAEVEHTDTNGVIRVENAKSAVIIITLGTDYELCCDTFTKPEGQKPTNLTTLSDTRKKVEAEMALIENAASTLSVDEKYEYLLSRHLDDYKELFGRVKLELDFDKEDLSLTTDKLLHKYKEQDKSKCSRYLEALYFQYGRYLLIASSRKGALPSHLQGAWNKYRIAPWSSGYWHNVNVQMNYWPAFCANLAETFHSYADYNKAYMPAAKMNADSVMRTHFPDKYEGEGNNGWCIGVGCFPYHITGDRSAGHLGFTTQLFWEYYQYTGDKKILENIVFPVLLEAARYITKCVDKEDDGKYLVQHCDSPEMFVDKVWYYTKGTTYAQSFAYLNNYHTLLAAKELGILDKAEGKYEILKAVAEQLENYDPIIIGLSGQVKEFREEDYYGSVGDEKQHRHISHLVGLYPGNLINSTTPAWLDGANVVLNNRGDKSTGWAVAHRICLWARAKKGNRAHDLLNVILGINTATNLWGLHPPFQIDGNFGATAGICEMLLQSQAGYIEPLAALPENWTNGSYSGLCARGGFEVSAIWNDSCLTSLSVLSKNGKRCGISYPNIAKCTLLDSDGSKVSFESDSCSLIWFDTKEGQEYTVCGFTHFVKPDAPLDLNYAYYEGKFSFVWDGESQEYRVYAAFESDREYTLLGTTNTSDFIYEQTKNCRTTFKIVSVDKDGIESDGAICYYNP